MTTHLAPRETPCARHLSGGKIVAIMRGEVTTGARTRLDAAAARAPLEVELAAWVRRAALSTWTARRVRVLLARMGWSVKTRWTLAEAARDLGVTRERVRQMQARLEDRLIEPSPRERVREALVVVAAALPVPESAVPDVLRTRGLSRGRIGVRGLLEAARLVGLDPPFRVSRLGWVVSGRARDNRPRDLSRREFVWTIRSALGSAGVATAENLVARFPRTAWDEMRPVVEATLAAAPWARRVEGTPYWCAWDKDRPSRRAPFVRTIHATVAACGTLPLAELLSGLRRADRYRRRARPVPDRELLRLVLTMDPRLRVEGDLVAPGPGLGADEALTPVQILLLELVRETQRASGEELVPLEVVVGVAHEAGMPKPTAYLNLSWAPFLYDVRRGVIGLRSAARRSPDAAG